MFHKSSVGRSLFSLQAFGFIFLVFVSMRCDGVIVGTYAEFPHAACLALTDDLVVAWGALPSLTRTAGEKPRPLLFLKM